MVQRILPSDVRRKKRIQSFESVMDDAIDEGDKVENESLKNFGKNKDFDEETNKSLEEEEDFENFLKYFLRFIEKEKQFDDEQTSCYGENEAVVPTSSIVISPTTFNAVAQTPVDVVAPNNSQNFTPISADVVAPVHAKVVAPNNFHDFAPIPVDVVAPIPDRAVAPNTVQNVAFPPDNAFFTVPADVVDPILPNVAAPTPTGYYDMDADTSMINFTLIPADVVAPNNFQNFAPTPVDVIAPIPDKAVAPNTVQNVSFPPANAFFTVPANVVDPILPNVAAPTPTGYYDMDADTSMINFTPIPADVVSPAHAKVVAPNNFQNFAPIPDRAVAPNTVQNVAFPPDNAFFTVPADVVDPIRPNVAVPTPTGYYDMDADTSMISPTGIYNGNAFTVHNGQCPNRRTGDYSMDQSFAACPATIRNGIWLESPPTFSTQMIQPIVSNNEPNRNASYHETLYSNQPPTYLSTTELKTQTGKKAPRRPNMRAQNREYWITVQPLQSENVSGRNNETNVRKRKATPIAAESSVTPKRKQSRTQNSMVKFFENGKVDAEYETCTLLDKETSDSRFEKMSASARIKFLKDPNTFKKTNEWEKYRLIWAYVYTDMKLPKKEERLITDKRLRLTSVDYTPHRAMKAAIDERFFSFTEKERRLLIKPYSAVTTADFPLARCLFGQTKGRMCGCSRSHADVIKRPGCGENHFQSASYAISAIASKQEPYDYVFVGPTCAADIRTIADFAGLWKSPVIGYVQYPEIEYSPTDTHSMINVVQYSISGIVDSLEILLKQLKQDTMFLVGPVSHDTSDESMSSSIRDFNLKTNILKIEDFLEFDDTDTNWTKSVHLVQSPIRTIVICTDFVDLYTSLYYLDIKNLSEHRFLIVLVISQPPEEAFIQSNIRSLIAGANIFIVGPGNTNFDKNYESMVEFLPDIEQKTYTQFLDMYNACYAYCFGSTQGAETSVNDYHELMNGKTITNKYGAFTFDENGEVLSDYAVYTLSDSDKSFEVILALNSTPKTCDELTCFSLTSHKFDNSIWDAAELEPPDVCLATNTCSKTKYWTAVFAASSICIVSIIMIILFYRRYQNNLFKMTWKISKEGLKIIDNKNADQGQRMVRELDHKKDKTDTSGQKKRVFASYALVGTQRGEFLRFKQLKKIQWTEQEKQFLYDLKQIQNDNLTKFLGVMDSDGKNIYFLFGLIDRASLEDFCLDLSFDMNNTFKSAFMRDICKGLQYLHKSSVGYHGFLNTCTCLIDTNWVLKMTHYGIADVIHDLHANGYVKSMENVPLMVPPAQFAWFAPEHLKDYDPMGTSQPQMLQGSQEGDIYCLGLIFYSMMIRKDPFSPDPTSIERASPTLIHDIINENLLPQFEQVGVELKAEEELLREQCLACWDRDPDKRPSIKTLGDTINAVYPSAKGNLVDQMIKISERYAENLEQQVAEKTASLLDAEKKTMTLLNEMLPASIAKSLKEGKHITPRSYPSATVMFIQLCDFPIFMNNSTPDQIIFFLNDIFEQFDKVIRQHDAYKVETTGETYMVASGVPNENDGRHIYELAEVSLKIRDLSYDYVVRHKRDFKVRVKIGFHAGPIAAGVIGVKSPRYCLFGDTVNFASRMQSNCPPNQIQTSEQTANLLINTHEYKLVKRGIVHVKGKGEVNCYWLNEHIHEEDVQANATRPLTKAGNIAQMAKTSPIS